MTSSIAGRFVRTHLGRGEIAAKAVPMSRPARMLLMVIDESCDGAAWVAKVHGCTDDDLGQLLAVGLVRSLASESERAGAARVPVESAVRNWSYDALYALLTKEARARFGLIKGLQLVLKVEGAADLQRLQALALEFVGLIRDSHGDDSASRFCRQLGASD